MTLALRAALGTALLALATGANAAYTFTNDGGGDGSLVGGFPAFTIVGSDNGTGDGLPNTASYVQVFDASARVTFTWRYDTADSGGGAFDPAGYVLDGQQFQLSIDGDPGEGSGGTTSVEVKANDTFGWYVSSVDSEFGRGELSVDAVSAAPVPEPAAAWSMLAGLIGLGVPVLRRRRR